MKKCPYCAELVQDDAIFCRYCKRELSNKNKLQVESETPLSTKKEKKPWIAILLNCFPLIMGLGYIYIGNWKRFGTVILIQLFSLAPMTWLGLWSLNPFLLAGVWIFTLFDGYMQTDSYNNKIL